ncbi:MAG TPA: hypothetical protein EYH42_07055 [Sulfurovum sp.]|nr:hypothetical protein [Sulfurovum sp.]
MTPLELIQQQLNNANLDEATEAIYQDLKNAKSPRSRIVFRSKSIIDKEQILSYLQGIINAEDPYNVRNEKVRYEEFLEYLCEVLEISKIDYEVLLDACRDMRRQYDALKEPYIYVDTNFRRKSELIIALAMLEPKRRIKIDKLYYLKRSEEENLAYVSNAVKLHYKWRKGVLALWGQIRNYIYYDGRGNRTVFNCLGDVIEVDEICESRASVTLEKEKGC